MSAPYTPTIGVPFGNNTDHQGFELRRVRLWNIAQSFTLELGSTPLDGMLAYRTDAIGTQDSGTAASTKKHLVYYSSGESDVTVPRTDCIETVIGVWAFNRTGSNPPFTCNQALPSAGSTATQVTNLNANYVNGYDTSLTAVQNKIPVYASSGRLKVGTPTDTDDAVTKAYADAMGAGLNIAALGPVQAATTASIADLSNATVTHDGVTLVEGQYLLVKDNASPDGIIAVSAKYNGIYTVGVVAGGSAPLTRRTDADTTAELDRCYTYVEDGTVNQGSSWVQTTNDPVIGTDNIVWTKFFQAVAQNPGNGIDITGNVVSVKISASTTYTTGAILYNGSTSTITGFTTAGVLQVTSGAAPTAATGTQYGLPYWATTTTLGTTLAGTATTLLHGNAAGAPTWSAVSLTADITGTLGIGNGGTNATSYGASRVIFMNAGNTAFSSDANFTFVSPALTIGVAGSATGIVKLTGATSGTVSTTVAAVAGTWTFTLPTSGGTANYALITDGAGVSSWSILPVAGGGTGAATLTGVLKGNGTSAITAMTGATNRVTFWSDANTLSSNAGFTYDGTTLVLDADFTFTGAQTLSTSTGILTITGTGGLTLNTAANTNILLSPNGTGVIVASTANATGVTTGASLSLSTNSLTTGTGLYVASSSLTSGLLVDLTVSGNSAAASQTALNILTSGANGTVAITTYGAKISNTHTNVTSGTNVALYLSASGAVTANYGLIVENGNVGIGTTSPTEILSLGNSAARKFWIENTATDVVGRALTVAAGGTVAGTAVSDVVGGNLILQSGLGTGTGASTISFQTGTTLTTGMTLQTMETKMTILGSGNVGIGTVSPNATGYNSNNTIVTIKGKSAPGTAQFELQAYGTTADAQNLGAITFLDGTGRNALIAGVRESGTGDAQLQFWTSPSGSAIAQRMVIDKSGNVGIGTTGPSSLLDITRTTIGVTQSNAYGLSLVNKTAAALNAQQYSPPLRWRGFGWKTDATAASQSVDFRVHLVPVQGAAAPTGYLTFQSSVNGAAYTELFRISSTTLTASAIVVTDANKALVSGGSLPAGGVVARGFTATLTGAASSYTVTHNLNTLNVVVQVYKVSTGQTWYVQVTRSTVNAVVIDLGFTAADGEFQACIVATA